MTTQHAHTQLDSSLQAAGQHLAEAMEDVAEALAIGAASGHAEATFDPVEAYFECITTCSLDDGECITTCTEMLREQV